MWIFLTFVPNGIPHSHVYLILFAPCDFHVCSCVYVCTCVPVHICVWGGAFVCVYVVCECLCIVFVCAACLYICVVCSVCVCVMFAYMCVLCCMSVVCLCDMCVLHVHVCVFVYVCVCVCVVLRVVPRVSNILNIHTTTKLYLKPISNCSDSADDLNFIPENMIGDTA